MTDQFVVLKTVTQSLGYTVKSTWIAVRFKELTYLLMHTTIRKMLKKCDSPALWALVRGFNRVGIPLLFMWGEH